MEPLKVMVVVISWIEISAVLKTELGGGRRRPWGSEQDFANRYHRAATKPNSAIKAS